MLLPHIETPPNFASRICHSLGLDVRAFTLLQGVAAESSVLESVFLVFGLAD